MSREITLDDILKTTNRLPYTENEIRYVMVFLKKEAKHGLDVNFHRGMMSGGREDLRRWLGEGIMMISCPQIDSDFVFAKVNAGRGLLGRQKARFAIYLGSVESNEFIVGASHGNILLGLTGINNIFRNEGMLVGGAF